MKKPTKEQLVNKVKKQSNLISKLIAERRRTRKENERQYSLISRLEEQSQKLRSENQQLTIQTATSEPTNRKDSAGIKEYEAAIAHIENWGPQCKDYNKAREKTLFLLLFLTNQTISQITRMRVKDLKQLVLEGGIAYSWDLVGEERSKVLVKQRETDIERLIRHKEDQEHAFTALGSRKPIFRTSISHRLNQVLKEVGAKTGKKLVSTSFLK